MSILLNWTVVFLNMVEALQTTHPSEVVIRKLIRLVFCVYSVVSSA